MSTSETPKGQVVTFYSYKGGTGRSMALANVAWILAANGRRVLVADWDLESPGLHRFFKPFIDSDAFRDAPGVMDIIRRYEEEARRESRHRSAEWQAEFTRLTTYVRTVPWLFPGQGTVDYLSAGRQNPDYSVALSGLDWDSFYNRLDGAALFDGLRDRMRDQYDYTLIDSRTGLNDVADICTLHLPDTLVACFTLSDQGIDGAADVARAVPQRQRLRGIRVLPVPMRVDPAEKEKRDAGRALARQSFAGLPEGLTVMDRERYWSGVEVPYQAFYAYEETLATFGDEPGSPNTLLAAYESLARAVARDDSLTLPRIAPDERARILDRYRRPKDLSVNEVVLEYAAVDQPWAEWIAGVLSAVDVRVVDRGPLDRYEPHGADEGEQVLTIVSEFLPLPAVAPSPARLGVQVSTTVPDGWSGFRSTAYLAGSGSQQPDEAADRLLTLFGRHTSPKASQARAVSPFPRREPRRSGGVPGRNGQFTGRTDLLLDLRAALHERPLVALVGLGGIGKTQLALEYAHRFRSSYDLIWWIKADSLGTVEGSIEDLAQAVNIPRQAERSRTAATTLDALRRGTPTSEWLLVLDNAEEPHQLGPLLAQHLSRGPGHVLVTTRSTDWRTYAGSVPVPVFRRPESTARLRGQVESLGAEDADDLAEGLGDLPLAVDAAIGTLRDGRVSARQFLERLSASVPQDETEVGRELQATFGVALDRLREQSPGAHRMLELFSVMAPEISLDLVSGDAMAAALAADDPSVLDRSMRRPLLQRLERFSLVTVDARERLVVMHRMLQEFVRGRMSPTDRDLARHQVHEVLAGGAPGPEVDDPALWPAFRRLWPHLLASDPVGCPDHRVRQLLVDRVRYLWLRGDWVQGEEFGTEVARHWEGILAKTGLANVPQTQAADSQLQQQLLRLRLNLANIQREQARFDEALELDRTSLENLTDLVGPHHALTLRAAAGYAADLRALGRYQEALDRERETSTLWSEHFGDDYPPALAAANNLAVSLRAVGNVAEAKAIDTRVYQRRSELLGPQHPRTFDSASALGRDLRESGEYQSSVEWLRDVVRRAAELAEPSPLFVLNARANLATSLRTQGSHAEAQTIFDDVYPQLLQYLGAGSPTTLACRLNRAVTLFLRDRAAEADTELQETAAAYAESLGPGHPLRLICLSNLSAIRRVAGQVEVARDLARQAAEGCARALGDDHPFTVAARMNLAVSLHTAGQDKAAAREMDEALATLRLIRPAEHPDVRVAVVNRELLRSDVSRSWSPEANDALTGLTSLLGRDNPIVRDLSEGRLVARFLDPNDPF